MSLPPRLVDAMPLGGPLIDPYGRAHTNLRVSVTDRCNYRCLYCLPAEGMEWMPKEHLLTFEEVARGVALFARMGVTGVRLTGGEPTVRRDVHRLVAMLGRIEGIEDLSMTTNGHQFVKWASRLATAGLQRVNVSLDTLDPGQFRRITRGGDLSRVLGAVDAARAAGLTPIKINVVIVAGENEDQVPRMVEHFSPHASDTTVRFIEYMPFGDDRRRNVAAGILRDRLSERYTLVPTGRRVGSGPAVNWRIEETGLVVGFISAITEHFCESCNRLRLMADGHLRTCLSRDDTPSLRDLIRDGLDDDALERVIREMVWQKVPGHEAHLEAGFRQFEGVMTRIGG
ncbi:MAG: GTP 3',8-cyclase MoaA [Deltaproteobacteria bacterium]|nr:GTP 3',8-cyclase MoaA [Deltaproteobacteria bacterium]MBW2254377.1 GTP 3',8-cyclase MoaA [Deltaproteobacteria bacterium]